MDLEEKARFGALCSGENGKGREWFAKYVSAQVSVEDDDTADSLTSHVLLDVSGVEHAPGGIC